MKFPYTGDLLRMIRRINVGAFTGDRDDPPTAKLLRDVASSDLDAAAHAATVLGTRGPRAVPGLTKLLGHWDGTVRELAAEALAATGPAARSAAPALALRLRSVGPGGPPPVASSREVAAAARAITASREPATVAALAIAASARDDEGGIAAVVALGELGGVAVAAVPIVLSRLTPEIGQSIVVFKVAAARALGRIGGPGVTALGGLVKSSVRRDRQLAAEALGAAGEDGVDTLVALFEGDVEPAVRADAATALGRTGSRRAADALRKALGSPIEEALRMATVAALKDVEGR